MCSVRYSNEDDHYYERKSVISLLCHWIDLFIVILAIFCIFEFSESFQWFALFDDFVGCTVLGVIREYTMISLLVIAVCSGTHLLILMTKPKCLQVINEVKLKRYKIIQKIYVIVSFLVPIVFVPWPFISVQYGNQGDMCWCVTRPAAVVIVVYPIWLVAC